MGTLLRLRRISADQMARNRQCLLELTREERGVWDEAAEAGRTAGSVKGMGFLGLNRGQQL